MTDPATLVATRVVPVHKVDAFNSWASRSQAAACEAPGARGTLRLEQAGGLVHLIYRFADTAALDAWTGSDAYRRLQQEGEGFPVELRQQAQGRTVAFDIPAESAASKLKTFVLTWVTVLPVLLAANTATRAIAGDLPPPVQLLISSPFVVALLTFVIQPRVQRWLRPWTLADAEGKARR
jgi:uncharacterized protein